MEFIKKHKRKLLLGVVFLLVAASLLTRSQDKTGLAGNALGLVVTPLQSAVTNIVGFAGGWAKSSSDRRDLAAQNQELQERIDELQAENDRLQLYAQENKELSSLLQISRQYADYASTGARVCAKDPGNWFDTFLIDKGETDGIAANMALLCADGLVGHVTRTGTTYAQAMTILDPNSSVSAKCTRTGDLGVVKGDYTLMSDGLCLMEYIDNQAQVIEGDEIVTSSLSDIYPAGILIGTVKEVRTDQAGLTKSAVVEPSADLKHLEALLVVTGAAENETAP